MGLKLPKIKIDEISLNTVLVFGAVVGVIYIGYKIKSGISAAADAVSNLDLNPFDEGSFIPNAIGDIVEGINKSVIQPTQTAQLAAAFAAKGLNINNYKLYTGGGRGSTIPSNAVYITVGRTGNYYVPKFNLYK